MLEQFILSFKWSSCVSRDALGVHLECILLGSFFKFKFIVLETIVILLETNRILDLSKCADCTSKVRFKKEKSLRKSQGKSQKKERNKKSEKVR